MNRISKVSVATMAATFLIAHPALAANTWAESRSDGMGGTGVASASYGSGVLINPALLAKAHEDDNVSVVLPSVGVEVSDKDNLRNEIDHISDTVNTWKDELGNINFSNYLQQLPRIQAAAGDLADELNYLDGKTASAKAAAGLAVSIPGSTISMAFVTKAWARARVSSYIDPNDVTFLQTIENSTAAAAAAALDPSAVQDNLKSTGFGRAAIVSDYGIALAKQFDIGGVPVSVGVTPKLQKTWLYNYSVSIYNYKSDDLRDSKYRNTDTGFNVDAGVAADFGEHWTVGLSGQNLVPRNIDTKEINGYKDTFQISPLVTAGVAWSNELLTLTADGDLTETKGFKSEKNSQYLRAGAEVRPLSWLAVRAGYQADIKGNDNNAVTAGLGFAPFNRVHLDLNGLVGEKETWGAGAQLTFTF
ncbi:conjugal transfer protein [Mangrovibacter phragmitis]|uniref:Conjugal transfer protein n=1 Tax=Mangrovibacter phragmitis TaxID=1691903 RepID=A0A1B7L592_9ENTR|nr:conjugal transfer protein TraF [Mangrovibacter phragmitis]OAT77579.1 conjugal transfer protein [Mangrovibacter phragmitis]